MTTNLSILAKAGIGLNGFSLVLTELLGPQSRLCAQVVSPTVSLPVNIVAQMFEHPAVGPAVETFARDWQGAFADKLSFES